MKALQLDGTLAPAHTALAFVMFEYDWDWSGAEKEFRRALELNPGYATGHHWYAYYLAAMSRVDESTDEIKRAQKLDPLSLIINRNVGWILYVGRQYDHAIAQLQKTLDLDANFVPAHATLELAYAHAGLYKEAAVEAQKVAVLSGNEALAGALGRAYALSGYRGVLLATIDALKRRAKQQYVSPADFAYAYARIGDRDHAIEWLEKSYQQRESVLAFLRVFPLLDPVRSDPRFVELCRRIGLRSD